MFVHVKEVLRGFLGETWLNKGVKLLVLFITLKMHMQNVEKRMCVYFGYKLLVMQRQSLIPLLEV